LTDGRDDPGRRCNTGLKQQQEGHSDPHHAECAGCRSERVGHDQLGV
jgi:hypothetical protein